MQRVLLIYIMCLDSNFPYGCSVRPKQSMGVEPTRNANWTTQCLLARNKRAKPASDQERERIFAKEGLYLSGDLLTLL